MRAYHLSHRYLTYFTDLSYIGIVAYFWAASVQTIAFVLRGRKSYPLQAWPRFFQLLHVVLYSTLVVFREFSCSLPLIVLLLTRNERSAIIVTAVFWSLLASSATFRTAYSGASYGQNPSCVIADSRWASGWSNISQHALNTGFALFEILFTHSGPSPWRHLIPLILILAGYLGVAYITHATQGYYSTFSALSKQ